MGRGAWLTVAVSDRVGRLRADPQALTRPDRVGRNPPDRVGRLRAVPQALSRPDRVGRNPPDRVGRLRADPQALTRIVFAGTRLAVLAGPA